MYSPIACDISPILYPFLANFIPSKKACFVTSSNFSSSFFPFPTMYVLAASPLNPSLYATRSILITSPSFKITLLEGIPCITSSFTDAHILAGKSGTLLSYEGYPFCAGIPPFFLIVSSAILSN